MSKRIRKRYTPEFKREAVSLVTEHGYSKAEAGRSLGINPNQIRRWQLALEADGSDAFPGQGKLTPDQKRIRDLESENRRLRNNRSTKFPEFFRNQLFLSFSKADLPGNFFLSCKNILFTNDLFRLETFLLQQAINIIDHIGIAAHQKMVRTGTGFKAV